MTNHVHLLISPYEYSSTSSLMQGIARKKGTDLFIWLVQKINLSPFLSLFFTLAATGSGSEALSMSKVTAQQVEELISLHPDVACFGSEADRVGDDWVKKAEERLGFALPESYKWFLRTYAGGEVGSEEIYSIYGVEFESVNGGDVVY